MCSRKITASSQFKDNGKGDGGQGADIYEAGRHLIVQRDFFSSSSNLYKKKIDKEGMEETITTFMGNSTTPTISAAQKDKCEGVVVESELL